jgi:hypothetical protein
MSTWVGCRGVRVCKYSVSMCMEAGRSIRVYGNVYVHVDKCGKCT